MRMPFFNRGSEQHEEEAEVARETVVVKVGDRIGAAWSEAWARSHAEQQGESDGVLCPHGGAGGGDDDDRLKRMRTAGEVTDRLFAIYRKTEAGILQADENLGFQKVFLLRLFRPLLITLSFHGTSLLRESDFVEPDRGKLTFDPIQKIAWPAPSIWAWREAERTICAQLSHNSKTLPILLNDIMRVLRTEHSLSIDAAPELGKYLALRTDEEMAGKVQGYQQYEPSYYIVKYTQIGAETEAKEKDAEALQAAEDFSFTSRLLVQRDMRRYPIAVKRHGERSERVEASIESGLRTWAPEFLASWKKMIADITPHYPVPADAGTGTTTTDTGGGED